MASRRGPDDSVRVSIAGTNGGTRWANVFYCQLTKSGTVPQADLDTWLNAFQAAYKTNLNGVISSNVAYTLARAVYFAPGGGELISTVNMTGNGTEAGAIATDYAASKVLSWLSSVYWRGGKPRTYLPGITAADISDGHLLTAGAISAAATAGANFRTAVNALTATSITGTALGFVSFRSGNAERVPPVFFPVTGCRVHQRIGTQRRRLGAWIS